MAGTTKNARDIAASLVNAEIALDRARDEITKVLELLKDEDELHEQAFINLLGAIRTIQYPLSDKITEWMRYLNARERS